MSSKDDDARPMNDTTMPPSGLRSKQPSRTTSSSSTTNTAAAAPAAATSSSATTAAPARKPLPKKAGARRGFGLADWHRLLRHSKNLAQLPPEGLRRAIPMDEVREHNSEYDGWTVLHGKVYNIAPYLHYHPGGVAILKQILGRDGTALFEKYHRWVNIHALVGPLLLGYVDTSSTSSAKKQKDAEFALPIPRPPTTIKNNGSMLGAVGTIVDEGEEEEEEEEDDPLALAKAS